MRGILRPLRSTGEFASLARGLEGENQQQIVYGLSGSQRSYLLGGLVEVIDSAPVLVITPGERESHQIADELAALLPDLVVRQFPAWQLLPYQVLAHSKEVVAQRLQVLESLHKGVRQVVVAPADALLRRLAPPQAFASAVMELATGDQFNLELLLAQLISLGYERVELVEERGQFALRGGILDVFPMTGPSPIRVDFFDDLVESIHYFNTSTQRSEMSIKSIDIYPARELPASPESQEAAIKALEKDYRAQSRKLARAGDREALRHLDEMYNEAMEGFGASFIGIGRFIPYFYPDAATFLDYFPARSPVFVEEPARVKEVIETVYKERIEVFTDLLGKGKILPKQLLAFADWGQIQGALTNRKGVYLSLLPRHPQFLKPTNIVNFPGKAMHVFMGNLNMLAEEIAHWRKLGYAVVILMSEQQRAQHIQNILKDHKISAFYAERPKDEQVRSGNVVITVGNLSSGFELPNCRLVVITESDIYGQLRKQRKERKRSEKLAPFVDLKVGDYVVHVNHGVGRYLGVVPLAIGGITKEYLLVQYAGEDKLYVPVDQVGLIQKYLGGEGEAPRLSRMGGGEWARVKGRVKEAVREMAQELLDLYAAREVTVGHAFGPDTVWQKEFEESFPYEETPDQSRAIDEVKSDMENSRPMDRLLCGDVGYGKTEVALRAAFKAVMDGKQVAVLVPTTILAQQHYNTFKERFAGHGVNVEVLSRFRSPKEQRQVIKELAQGTVDIVIGTHRLVQEDIQFKDMGLLIVDEEQRFGVAHKERLKFMRKNVDVLTLTATPIPRTLHMSLVDVRDTSLLETPPEDRYPVQTYVLEEDPVLIREAIRREMSRGGQVFFVYNRVIDMDRVARWVQSLVPEARMAIAHGQMKEDELEQVMLDFMGGEYDVLICTTIIENGLDIPNVNTLVVKEADMMGLAQLYQLRGRVGRSNRLAYAYFTFRRDKVLGEAAEKRLAAIRELTELGSGFKIAMRDLEIRGAGNILGAEQHGHIAAVGFDLYARLLEEAVREARGEEVSPAVDTSIELPVEAYIPDIYIADTNQKVEIYKRIAGLSGLAGLSDLEEELIDRFGPLPVPVQNLLAVAKVRVQAGRLKVKNISLLPGQYRLMFAQGPALTGEALVAVGRHYPNRVKYAWAGDEFEVKLRLAGDGRAEGRRLLTQLEEFLAVFEKAGDNGAGSGLETQEVATN